MIVFRDGHLRKLRFEIFAQQFYEVLFKLLTYPFYSVSVLCFRAIDRINVDTYRPTRASR